MYNCPLCAWAPVGGIPGISTAPTPRALDVEKIKIEEKGEMCRLFTWITKIII
jgi:hypothetical protein